MGKGINEKRGAVNIFIPLGIVIIMIVLFSIFLTYYQVTVIINGIKQDLFYILQNSIIGCEQEGLKLGEYIPNNVQIYNAIESVITKNYIKEKSSIIDMKIEELNFITNSEEASVHTNGRINESMVHVRIKIKFKPIIKFENKEVYDVILHEDVKVSFLKYV